MASSRAKQLKTLVNKNKKHLSPERIEALSQLFGVVDGAIVYELNEYLTMSDEQLFIAIQDSLDYDIQALKHGNLSNDAYIDKYNTLVEKDNKENFAIEEVIKAKIRGLKTFAPKNLTDKLEKCTVYVLNHEIWIAIDEKVKLICFFTEEHELSEIHLYGYNPFYGQKDFGHADTAMYVYCMREEIFDESTMNAIKVWRTAVMEINKELWTYKSVIVDNLIFFRNFGTTQRKFKKTNKQKTLEFTLSMNLQTPSVVNENVNGEFFRRHYTTQMKLKNTTISYIHRLSEYIINFRYKILPDEIKDN